MFYRCERRGTDEAVNVYADSRAEAADAAAGYFGIDPRWVSVNRLTVAQDAYRNRPKPRLRIWMVSLQRRSFFWAPRYITEKAYSEQEARDRVRRFLDTRTNDGSDWDIVGVAEIM